MDTKFKFALLLLIVAVVNGQMIPMQQKTMTKEQARLLLARLLAYYPDLLQNRMPLNQNGMINPNNPYQQMNPYQNNPNGQQQIPLQNGQQLIPNYQNGQQIPNYQNGQQIPNYQNGQQIPNYQNGQQIPNFQG